MTWKKRAEESFLEASALLPLRLRCAVRALDYEQRYRAEEFRLRVGHPVSVVFPEGERPAGCGGERTVTADDLTMTLEMASQGSVHTVIERIKNGFITVAGGHRLGLCGSGVIRGGGVINFTNLSSLSLRIAKEVPGAAEEIVGGLLDGGRLQNTLILSPPGGGKTTLLRDLIRCVSDGVGLSPMRVGVADERGELACMEHGTPRMTIGARTDVMDGLPKKTGLLFLLRGMNPQVLATDEITAPEDIEALETAAGCGVILLATAHGKTPEQLRSRPVYRRLLDESIFQKAVVITMEGQTRRYAVMSLGETAC